MPAVAHTDPAPLDATIGSKSGREVLIVGDDEPRARRLLAVLARCRPELSLRAGSLAELVGSSRSGLPGVVICSCDNAVHALAALRKLRELQGIYRIVVVPDAAPAQVRELFAIGADGLVLTPTAEETLGPTLEAVSAGQLVLPATRRGHLAPPPLSIRERQVLGLVVLGLSNREVALKLHVSEATVKSHLTASFRKLGVRSRSQATARLLDPHAGLGLGVLSLTDADGSLDLLGPT